MRQTKHAHHFSYATTAGERIYSIVLGPFLALIGILVLIKFFPISSVHLSEIHVDALFVSFLLAATAATLSRLLIAYFLALLCAIPLALLTVSSRLAEKIFLPMFDVLESIPVLAFFPILILFFIRADFANGAAVFILFLSMLWNIVFTVVGGLKIIPRDISFAAQVFGIKGWKYFKQVTLPAIFPEIVTGSILAFAQGWNLIIVVEVIHNYIPNGTYNQDLFGIGSILVNASATGRTELFVACLFVMIVVIALFNYLIWQNLIHFAEKFKFE